MPALIVGTNSYVTLVEADSYFVERLYASEWGLATSTEKEKALIMAARMIDRCAFSGKVATADQAMAWPRVNMRDDQGRDLNLLVPRQIKDAQCELAYALLKSDITVDSGRRGLKSKEVSVGAIGSKEVFVSIAQTQLPQVVEELLRASGLQVNVATRIAF